MAALSFALPWPPSLNRYYRAFRGRVLISRDGRRYRMMAVSRLGGTARLEGDLSLKVLLHPPDRRRRDADNPLKCLLDSLTHAGVWTDDSQVKDIELHMLEPRPPDGEALVEITEKDNG